MIYFKQLITIFFILISTLAFSQWSWVDDHPTHNISTYTGHAVFQDSLILIAGQVTQASCYYETHFMLHVKTGDTAYWYNKEYRDPLGHSFYPFNDNYIIASYDRGNDDVGGDGRIRVVLKDREGLVMWHMEHAFQPNKNETNYYAQFVDVAPSGLVLVGTDHNLFLFDTVTQKSQEIVHSIKDSIIYAKFLNDSILVCATAQSAYKFDTSGQMLDSVIDEKLVDVSINGDTVTLVHEQFVGRYTSDFRFIDTIYTSQNTLLGYQNGEDKKFIIEQHYDSVLIIDVTKSRDVKVNSFVAPKTNRFDFQLLDSSFYFIDSEQGQIHVDWLPLYRMEHDPIHHDISLKGVKIYNVKFNFSPPSTYDFKTQVTVKNNSDREVTSFALYSFFRGVQNCVSSFYYELFDSISIPPDSTLTVLGKVNGWNIGLVNSYQDMCFTLLAPNSELDGNFDNNNFCDSYQLLTTEMPHAPNDIFVFPNPATEVIQIVNSLTSIERIQIINILGEIKLDIRFENQAIDVSTLPKGLYFVHLKSKTENYTQKIQLD